MRAATPAEHLAYQLQELAARRIQAGAVPAIVARSVSEQERKQLRVAVLKLLLSKVEEPKP